MRTFDELFAEHRLTAEERRLMVWHLASMRQRRLIETLLRPARPGGGERGSDGRD